MKTKGLKDFELLIKYNKKVKPLFLVQTGKNNFSNTKMPIYNFSNEEYQQVAKGKRLIEGLIAIKQTDIKILTMKIDEEYNSQSFKTLNNELKELEEYGLVDLEELRGHSQKLEEKLQAQISYDADNNENVIELLGNHEFELIMREVISKNAKEKREITKVNFTHVTEDLDITMGSGVVVYKYFGNWSK